VPARRNSCWPNQFHSANAALQVVGEAADGREAVDLAQKLQPDIVLMDVAMPELNGIEATRRLIASTPGCAFWC
jgi:YesN/AraC family two-component response regulator